MISKLARVKNIVLEVLNDGKEHTSDEIKRRIGEEGIELDNKCSTLRTAIYQLRNSGIDIYSKDRGVYQIKDKNMQERNSILQGFTTLMPEQKLSSKYIYIHADGKLILNGRLNSEIKSRQIEIRISDNGKKLALIPDGEYNHKFTKNGSTKNMTLLKKLKNKHVSLPVTYEMKLDTNSGIWMGEICQNKK